MFINREHRIKLQEKSKTPDHINEMKKNVNDELYDSSDSDYNDMR